MDAKGTKAIYKSLIAQELHKMRQEGTITPYSNESAVKSIVMNRIINHVVGSDLTKLTEREIKLAKEAHS